MSLLFACRFGTNSHPSDFKNSVKARALLLHLEAWVSLLAAKHLWVQLVGTGKLSQL
jgi:hypothetical protein